MKEAELMGMKENTAVLEKGTVCVEEPEKKRKKNSKKEKQRAIFTTKMSDGPSPDFPQGVT